MGQTDTEPSHEGKAKAFAWARVSTDMQEQRGASIPEQLREIREYASRNGFDLIQEFSEAASAFQKDSKRVEFHRMLEKARNGAGIKAIIVHDMSRFSRDSLMAKSLVREFRDSGIKVISLNDPEVDPDSPAGVYLEAITYAKNEAYSREVAFHTRKGCRANAQTRDQETGWCYWNGGQPIWGYKIQRLNRGTDKSGRPIVKSIIVPDEAIINGKPIYEWAKEALTKVLKGYSLAALRDFCNGNGIPAPRGQFWQVSTWTTLLKPHALLKFAGYGVWNVHRKNGSIRPISDWLIVENAHQALISADTAQEIALMRHEKSKMHTYDKGFSRESPYLLSGGLFICERCGNNMTGYKSNGYRYYICGSQPYRRGLGCGKAVYVPQDRIEAEVISGIQYILDLMSHEGTFLEKVNRAFKKLWAEKSGYDPNAASKIQSIDRKIANIRQSIEDGIDDAEWTNTRLRSLKVERDKLLHMTDSAEGPEKIELKQVRRCVRDLGKLLSKGQPDERKRYVRCWVEHIKIAPDALDVKITYRLPEHLLRHDLAGGGFEPPTSGL